MLIDAEAIKNVLHNPLTFYGMDAFVWMFIGLTMMASLHSLLLYFNIKDINYLNFFLHLLTSNYLNFTITGFGERYIWPSFPQFTVISFLLSHGLCVITIILFTSSFFEVKKNAAILYKFLNFCIILPVIMIVVSYYSIEMAFIFIPIMGFFVANVLNYTMYFAVKNKMSGAYFYVFSIITTTVLVFPYIMQFFNFFQGNIFVRYSLLIGNFVEVVLLTFALTRRIKTLQDEKEYIYKKSLEQAKKIQDLVNLSGDCFWETDKRGYLRFISENIYKILELKDTVYRKPEEIFTDDAFAESKIEFIKLLNLKKSFSDFEIVGKSSSGKYLWFKCSAQVVLNDNNEFDGFLGTFTNITQTKNNLSEEFITTNTKSLTRIAGAIAHEINNPLAFIQLCIDYISSKANSKDTLDAEFLKNNLAKMKQNSIRISQIVGNLQGMATKVEQSNLELCSLSEVTEKAVNFCEYELSTHKIKCSIDLMGKDDQILVHKEEIFEALINIIQNSIEEVEKTNSPWIKIKIEKIADDVVVSVTDSGKGIPVTQRRSVFEPFFTTKDFKNIGLGLTQSLQFIERNGGTLTLDPSSEQTKFILKFKAQETAFSEKS